MDSDVLSYEDSDPTYPHFDIENYLPCDDSDTDSELLQPPPPAPFNPPIVNTGDIGPDDLREMGIYSVADAEKWVAANPDEWVVDQLLLAKDLHILASDPKTGKSSLCRTLAHAVASGKPFLDRPTLQGPVVNYALEDRLQKSARVWKAIYPEDHLRHQLPIYTCPTLPHGTSYADIFASMLALWNRLRPRLYILDLFSLVTPLRDLNDYTEVAAAVQQYRKFLVEHNIKAAILFVHHTRKEGASQKTRRMSAMRVLGSTAFRGTVLTNMTMDLDEKTSIRYIQSEARDGRDIPRTALEFDPLTETVDLAKPGFADDANIHSSGDKHRLTAKEKAVILYNALKKCCKDSDSTTVMTADWLIEAGYPGNRHMLQSAMPHLLEGMIIREGGKDGQATPKHPWLYRPNPAYNPQHDTEVLT